MGVKLPPLLLPESLRGIDVVLLLPKKRKKSRQARCRTCGLTFPVYAMHVEYDTEDRAIGLVCEGCY